MAANSTDYTALITLAVAIIAATPGIISLVLKYRSDKHDPNTLAKYIKIVDDLTTEVTNLKAEVVDRDKIIEGRDKIIAARDATLKEWTAGIALLIAQLAVFHKEPIWTPKSPTETIE